MEDEREKLSLSQLALITGLSDRMLRNHLASGILQGEKIEGKWVFTAEQIEEFVCHPAVRPGILAKQNAAVYDFLLENGKTACETCMVVDFPQCSKAEIARYFCSRISSEEFRKIHFSFDGVPKVPRVILKGDTADVLRLINGFWQEQCAGQPEK